MKFSLFKAALAAQLICSCLSACGGEVDSQPVQETESEIESAHSAGPTTFPGTTPPTGKCVGSGCHELGFHAVGSLDSCTRAELMKLHGR